MSADPTASPSRPAGYDDFVDQRIGKTRAAVKTADLATAAVTLLGGLLALLLIAAAADHWLVSGGLDSAERYGMWAVGLSGLGLYVATRLAPVILRPINPLYAAQEIERESPQLKNSLLNALQLRGGMRNPAIDRAVQRQAAERLAAVGDAPIDHTPLVRSAKLLLVIVAAVGIYVVASPKDFFASAGRVLAPWADINAPSRVQIAELTPGDAEVDQGDRLEASASVTGLNEADTVELVYSTTDGRVVGRRVVMRSDRGSRYTASLPPGSASESALGLQGDLVYWIEAGDARSPRNEVTVRRAATITPTSIRYEYPAYTGYPSRVVEGAGDLEAIEGTRVTITAEANLPIESAQLDLGADGRIDTRLKVDGSRAVASLPLRRPKDTLGDYETTYVLRFTSVEGRANHSPPKYRVGVLADLPPEPSLLTPEDEVLEVRLDQRVRIEAEGRDPDFRLAALRLMGEADGRPLLRRDLPVGKGRGRITADATVTPRELGLQPGQTLTYWIEAADNRTPEPNRAESRRQQLRVLAESEEAGDGGADGRPQPGANDQQQQDPGQEGQQQPGGQGGNSGAPNEQNPDSPPQENQPGDNGEQQQGQEQQQRPQAEQGENGDSGEEQPGGLTGPGKQGDQTGEDEQDASGGSEGQPGAEQPPGASDAGGSQSGDGDDSDSSTQQESGGDQGAGGSQQGSGDQKGGGEPGEGGAGEDSSPVARNGEDDGSAFERLKEFFENQQRQGSQDSDPSEGDPGDGEDSAGERDAENGQEAAPSQNDGADGNQTKRRDGPAGEQPERSDDGPGAGDQDRTGEQSDSRNSDPGGESPPGQQNQRSQAPREGGGDAGQNQAADQGTGQAGDRGAGESSGKPGEQQRADRPTGESGGQRPGEGSQAEDGGQEQPGGESASGDDNRQGDSQDSGQEGSQQEGGPEGRQGDPANGSENGDSQRPPEGDQPGELEDQRGEGPSGESNNRGQEPGKPTALGDRGPGNDSPGAGTEIGDDDANLDYTRKQTELVLERLEKQLAEREVDRKLLDKLGWTEDDLRRFVDRWRGRQREAVSRGAEGQTKLDRALKSLGLSAEGPTQTRELRDDELRDLRERARVKTPARLRERLQNYNRSLNAVGDPPAGE